MRIDRTNLVEEEDMVRVSFSVTAEHREMLTRAAHRRGTTIGLFLRNLVSELEGKIESEDQLYEQARPVKLV